MGYGAGHRVCNRAGDGMIVYIGGHGAVGGKGSQVELVRSNDNLGFMFTPFDAIKEYRGRYAFDNGAFSAYVNGFEFNDEAFLKAFRRLAFNADFIVLPDKVAAGKKSLNYSLLWRDFLPEGYRYYLAIQDGMTHEMVLDQIKNRNLIDGIFIGGTMEWKQKTAESWISVAHNIGAKCHIGRVGTAKGLQWAERIGADSVDSSNFAQHEKNWIELIAYLKGNQRRLSGVVEKAVE